MAKSSKSSSRSGKTFSVGGRTYRTIPKSPGSGNQAGRSGGSSSGSSSSSSSGGSSGSSQKYYYNPQTKSYSTQKIAGQPGVSREAALSGSKSGSGSGSGGNTVGLSPTQIKRASSLTEAAQIKEYGRVVTPQPKLSTVQKITKYQTGVAGGNFGTQQQKYQTQVTPYSSPETTTFSQTQPTGVSAFQQNTFVSNPSTKGRDVGSGLVVPSARATKREQAQTRAEIYSDLLQQKYQYSKSEEVKTKQEELKSKAVKQFEEGKSEGEVKISIEKEAEKFNKKYEEDYKEYATRSFERLSETEKEKAIATKITEIKQKDGVKTRAPKSFLTKVKESFTASEDTESKGFFNIRLKDTLKPVSEFSKAFEKKYTQVSKTGIDTGATLDVTKKITSVTKNADKIFTTPSPKILKPIQTGVGGFNLSTAAVLGGTLLTGSSITTVGLGKTATIVGSTTAVGVGAAGTVYGIGQISKTEQERALQKKAPGALAVAQVKADIETQKGKSKWGKFFKDNPITQTIEPTFGFTGRQSDYAKNVRKTLTSQGLSFMDVETGVREREKERFSKVASKTTGLLASEIVGEASGFGLISAPLKSKSLFFSSGSQAFAYTFPRITTAATGEIITGEYGTSFGEYSLPKVSDVYKTTVTYAPAAGVLGSSITGLASKGTKKGVSQSKKLLFAARVIDPTEIFGDVSVDIARKTARIKSPVFTFSPTKTSSTLSVFSKSATTPTQSSFIVNSITSPFTLSSTPILNTIQTNTKVTNPITSSTQIIPSVTSPVTTPITSPTTIPSPITMPLTTPITIPEITSTPITTPITTPTTTPTTVPIVVPTYDLPGFIIPPILPSGGGGSGFFKSKKKGSRSTKYLPSLVGIFKRQKRKKGFLTGLEIRGI